MAIFLWGISVSVNCYKILGVIHVPSRSHYITFNALMKGLVKAGHEVTLLTALEGKKSSLNYEEIFLERSLSDALKGNLSLQ